MVTAGDGAEYVNTAEATATDKRENPVHDSDTATVKVTTPETPQPPATPQPPSSQPSGEQQVLPEEIVSGVARLRGPSGCVQQAVQGDASAVADPARDVLPRRAEGQAHDAKSGQRMFKLSIDPTRTAGRPPREREGRVQGRVGHEGPDAAAQLPALRAPGRRRRASPADRTARSIAGGAPGNPGAPLGVSRPRLNHMARRLLPLCLLLALCAAPGRRRRGRAAAAQAEERPRPARERAPLQRATLTRWAHTNLLGPIRSKPTTSGKTIGRLRWNTEDGLPEVYVVLESRLDDDEARLAADPHPRRGRTAARAGCARSSSPTSRRSGRT